MSVELLPLKPNQHTVTFVPRVTTDLPFFNLTYHKHDTPTEIKFEGKDEFGNPINWEVFHNTSDRIGYPGVQAHEVWYLLIKPAIDASRNADGSIPNIIPLGGVRECLRMIGWTAGGHEAKELLKVLSQIGSAFCFADLWFPTGEKDENGNQKFRQVKGRFSRMTIYAIGDNHLTQEELENAEFDFELEDTLYIQLNPLEIQLQQLQEGSQKLIDNEYMFSVKPIARRWYELMTGKVFGTVRHNAPYFEIKYSWYMKHHHTLKRFYEMKRVKEQMNRVVQDHLRLGFLEKVEYRKEKKPETEIDFIIRYYIGQTAKDSIKRIKGYLLNKERKKKALPPKVKKANITPKIVEEAKKRSNLPTETKTSGRGENLRSESISESREVLALLDTVTEEHRDVMRVLMFEYDISTHKAYTLATEKLAECQKQIEALEFRDVKLSNRAGFLIKAIEENYSLPEDYLEKQEAGKKREVLKAKKHLIENCSLCLDNGMREILTDDQRYPTAYRQCTHDAEVESKFKSRN